MGARPKNVEYSYKYSRGIILFFGEKSSDRFFSTTTGTKEDKHIFTRLPPVSSLIHEFLMAIKNMR